MTANCAWCPAGYYVPITYRGVTVLWQYTRDPQGDFEVSPLGIPWETATLLMVLLCHGIGGLVYVKHWPQCVVPDRWRHFVSHWCHSHILMHIMLFLCYNTG